MKAISPARLIFWMKHRLLAAERRIAAGDIDDSLSAKVYNGLFEKPDHIAQKGFEFTTSEFARRFELDSREAKAALNQLAESHFVRHVVHEGLEDIWVGTQDTVVQAATSYQHGVLTLNSVKRFVEHPGTRAILKRIQAEPNVLRIVLGGNWLNKHARASIGAAVVIDGTQASESLVKDLEELGKRLDHVFRAQHTLPPFLLPVTERFPTLFHNAITISPITNWRVSHEDTCRSSDRAISEQLREQWNRNQRSEAHGGDASDSLMVHAFAMRHFHSEGKTSEVSRRLTALNSKAS